MPKRIGIHWADAAEPEWIDCTILGDPYPDPRGTGRLMVNVRDADGSYQPAVPLDEVREQ